MTRTFFSGEVCHCLISLQVHATKSLDQPFNWLRHLPSSWWLKKCCTDSWVKFCVDHLCGMYSLYQDKSHENNFYWNFLRQVQDIFGTHGKSLRPFVKSILFIAFFKFSWKHSIATNVSVGNSLICNLPSCLGPVGCSLLVRKAVSWSQNSEGKPLLQHIMMQFLNWNHPIMKTSDCKTLKGRPKL